MTTEPKGEDEPSEGPPETGSGGVSEATPDGAAPDEGVAPDDARTVDATHSSSSPSVPPPTASSPTAPQPAPEESAADEAEPVTVEGLVESLELVASERDGYLDSLMRLQAEFENYKKAVAKREADARDRANEGLVTELLPILDACDGAVANGAEDVAPVKTALNEALVKHGLVRLEPEGETFDPEQHEAVMHEEGEAADDGPMVAEVLRVGYQLKGRTVRPAMVRTRG